MATTVAQRIIIAGAGSIGCYVGGCLALAGRDVSLLLRPRMADQLRAHGLRISDCTGRDEFLAPERLQLATDAAALADAEIVLVTVKSAATAEIAKQIAAHCQPGVHVLSLQNGVGNADALRAALPSQNVAAGMVGFNAVQLGEGRFHAAIHGAIGIADTEATLARLMTVEGFDLSLHPDMTALLWGKLLINLNNALNALSGLPIVEQLQDRAWRGLWAAMVDEAQVVLRAAGIQPAKVAVVGPRLMSTMLRLPTPVYRRLTAAMLKMDPEARTSMWDDLQQRRMTEVDYLQGAVVALAAQQGRDAPVCRRVTIAVHEAEAAGAGSPHLRAEQLRAD